jgi:multidrug efflux pump
LNPSALFIRRPVATTLITLAIALIGIAAYFVLPVSALPAIDLPTISIQAQLPGASPNIMATTVASPLERTLGQIADVTEMTSQSGLGTTRIILQFGLDRDINGAARDVEASINAARALLPTTLTSNPSYRKVNPANRPIILLGLTSDTMTTPQVYDAADTILNQALSQVQGVGEVDLGGGASPSVRVEMNPLALNKYGIGLEDVRAAITSTNAFTPKGAVSNGPQRFQIYTNDQATEAAQYRDVIIAYRNGAPVRIRDVADVVDGPQDIHNLGLVNGKPGIVVRVTQAPGANVVATIDRIRALLPQLQAQLPPAVHLQIMLDNSTSIRAALADVERTLMIAIVLVVLVVLVFLRNGRATLIPGVAVTVSLMGTLALMYALHFSLDNLSLMALTVATGFVVDDAIVVLENITRHVEDGMPRYRAAIVGAGEVGFTVVSMSISLIAVFIPILMMGGIVGKLFREFAMTLSSAIVISLFISLTATPMMASLLIDEHPGEGPNAKVGFWSRMSNRFEAAFEWLLGVYEKALNWALDNSLIVLLSLIATVILTVYLYVVVPKGFFPQEDTGLLIGGLQADQASSFDSVAKKAKTLQRIVMHDPAVATSAAFTQAPGGFMFVSLKPENQRPGVTADMVLNRLRPKLARVAGVQLFLQSAQDLQIGGRQANAQYQYTLQSDDLDALHSWSDKLLNALKKVRDLTDVNTDQQNHALSTFITYDRQTAARFGLTSKQIDATLNDAFGQSFASIIYKPQNQYHVVMEVAQPYQQGPDALKDIYVTPAGGGAAAAATKTATGASGGGGGRAALPSLTTSPAPLSGISSTANPDFVSSGNGLASSSSSSSSSSSGGSSSSTATGSSSGAAASSTGMASGSFGASATSSGGSATSSSNSSNSSTGSSNTPTNAATNGASSSGSSGTSGSTSSTTTANSGAIGGTATSGAGIASSTTGGATAVSTGVAISTSPEVMTPLSAFSSYALSNTPLAVNHQGQSAATTLSFNLAPGKSLSDAQRDIAQVQQQIGMPTTVTGSFQGTAKVFQQSLANEPILILAALVAVYIVLGILYESYVHPLTVLSTIPSAGVGAVLALMIFHIEFSIIALIGVVLLIGIVKKNAIMIIDFALVAERDQGLSSHDAIYQACVLRFRPIMMTTCAAIMGAVPLAVGLGEGGELRQPLGVAIIGGLVVSQFLTLLTTPVVYLYLDKLRRHGPRRLPRGLRTPTPAPAE